LNNELLELIRELASELASGEEALAPAVMEILERAYAELEGLLAQYEAPAPEGAEEIRQCMLEALNLYLDALDRIREVDASGEAERLKEAVEWAEEASDLLDQIDYLIDQAQVTDAQPERA
jgi:hypothetical protein